MRTTLFTTICAILLGAVTLSAQQTTDKYVINGKEIQEVFDGSQLEGLKVESYKIETSIKSTRWIFSRLRSFKTVKTLKTVEAR